MRREINAGRTCIRRVVWIWVIRDRGAYQRFNLSSSSVSITFVVHINWLQTELMKALTSVPSTIEFTAQIYITAPSTSAEAIQQSHSSEASSLHTLHKTDDPNDPEQDKCANSDPEKCSSDASGAAAASIDGVEIFHGRPDLGKILEETIVSRVGPISVDGECKYVENDEILTTTLSDSLWT